jgi:1-acyl-sn-glycerol-3-phosphate acyltransferase
MALQFEAPIVPVSLVGAFEFNRKTSWMLRPGTITVHLHDTIETAGLGKEDLPALRDRVHAIVSHSVEEALDATRSGQASF